MGSQPEDDPLNTDPPSPQLPLFSLPPLRSPHHSGTLTPPHHTHASIPFRWEQEPGKPLPCTTLAIPSDIIKSLDLPPRLLNDATAKPKTPSPTTVLDGPYLGSSILESSSFRFLRKRQGSFDGAISLGGMSRGSSPERGLLGPLVVSSSSNGNSKKDKGMFGSWRKRTGKGKSEVHVGNFVFPSFSDDGIATGSCDTEPAVKVARISRKRSLMGLSHAKSHFWASIYSAFKQVIPRRSTKWKKDAL